MMKSVEVRASLRTLVGISPTSFAMHRSTSELQINIVAYCRSYPYAV